MEEEKNIYRAEVAEQGSQTEGEWRTYSKKKKRGKDISGERFAC